MALHNPILDKAREKSSHNNGHIKEAKDDRLQTVEEALDLSAGRIATSIAELTASTKQTAVATDVIKSATKDITSATQIIAKTRATADLQAQNATIAAFEVGGGRDAQVNIMKELVQDNARVDAILEERLELAAEDRFGEGIGLIDTAINQFNINLTNQQLRVAQAKQQHTERQITNISAATETFSRINALTRTTLNEGTIEANYKLIEAEGRIKAAEAEIKNLHSNATAMSNLMAADSRGTNNLLQAYRLEGEAQERELKVERTAFLREQMEVTRKQWETQQPAAEIALEQAQFNLERSKALGPTQRLTAELALTTATKRHNDQVETEEKLVLSVQRAQSLAGVPIEDKSTITFGLRRSGDVGKKYSRLLEIGGAPDPILGLTPFEAKASIDLIAPTGNIKPSTSVKLLAQISSLQAEKYALPNAKVPRDDASLAADFNATAKEAITLFSSNIANGDNSNPYQSPPFTVLEESADLQLQPLYNKVLKAKQMKETNPQTIMDAAIDAILAGIVSPEEAAAGIEAVFDLAALINNTQDGGFRRIGLPNQTTYITKITRPPSFIEELKVSVAPRRLLESIGVATIRKGAELFPNALISVDLMDRTKVQEMIIKILSTTRASVKEGGKE